MKAFNREILREIKNTSGRFMAILAIVALGVSFYAGFRTSNIDMKITGDDYFDGQNLMDIRVVSTYGINRKDVLAIENTEGVEKVYPSYNIDALAVSGPTQMVVKVHGIAESGASGGEAEIAPGGGAVNVPDIVEGRMPAAANEAVAERDFFTVYGIKPGDSVELKSGKKEDIRYELKNTKFTLVGIVNSVYYVSTAERGPSSIGSGSVHFFMYIPERNFRKNVFSEAFVTVEGARAARCFQNEYEDLVKPVYARLEELGKTRVRERYLEAVDMAYNDITAAADGLAEFMASAADEIEAMHTEIAEANAILDEARRELTVKSAELGGGRRDFEAAAEAARSGGAALDEAAEEALAASRLYAAAGTEINEAIAALETEAAGLSEKEALARAGYMDDAQALAGYLDEIAGARAEIGKARGALQRELESASAAVEAARGALAEVLAARAELDAESSGLPAMQAQIRDGEIRVLGGYASLGRNINELDRKAAQLAEAEAEAAAAAREIELQIAVARKAVNNAETPKWYVYDRDDNPGYTGYFNDADSIEAIGNLFPLLYFIVAALVSLTTMTRLVEERRTEIGTLKSLGYGDYRIISKYVIYAVIPTLFGGVAGGLIGMRFYPAIILSAYDTLYTTPPPVYIMDAGACALGITMALTATLAATVSACANELRASPTVLMRPKPPKLGAKIFLEKLPFFWKGIKFVWKVTIRNIFRYKKRLFMTAAGIAGCTGLLLTGFGLRDSIDAMIRLHFEEVNRFDFQIAFADGAKKSEREAVAKMLRESPVVAGSTFFRQKQYDASGGADSKTASVNVVTPSDADILYEFTSIRDRLTHNKIGLPDSGTVITEKLAQHLGVAQGDRIYFANAGAGAETEVAGIAEYYFGHYAYMTNGLHSGLFGKEPEYNGVYVKFGDHTEEQKKTLANAILKKKGVVAVFFTSDIVETFDEVIESLNFVVYIMIASAAALAVIVLLNLTSINISERKRELATIEVLGFYDKEVSSYIYRENVVLTLIGAVAGLGLGVVLHSNVIRMAETEIMMFGRDINTSSYIISMLLTFLFAYVVNLVTARKLRAIDMVEALKAVE